MTLRGRLSAAFLAVVLGPVLLGSFFVGMTVATVSRDRTNERLDHAVTTARTAIGAMCRQLQAVADAVAVLPAAEQRAAAGQMVARGLATEVRISEQVQPGERNCDPAPEAAGGAQATAVVAGAVQGDVVVLAVERVDPAFVQRLGGTSGVEVSLSSGAAGGSAVRQVPMGAGQPLPLEVQVRADEPVALYVFLTVAVLTVAGLAIVAARWLARSTTRPLEELAWAAGRVADGELGVRVPVGRADEIGQLGETFNRMTRELQAYVQALTASRDQLRGHLTILGDTLSSTHDLHRILQVLLRTALSATGARAGVVLLIDQAEGVLVARCAEGLSGPWDVPEDKLPTLRIPIGHGILGTVAAEGEPRRGPGKAASEKGRGPSPVEPGGGTYLAVPICAPATVGDPLVPGDWVFTSGRPATLGVLALYDRLGADEFDDADLLTLRTFAGQAGVAVHNVRMHEEAQRLSLTDPLTGLWNYRYLRESLRREVERASRFGRMFTVLVLDLDHFKEVNDTYGHAAGDTVLGEFARRVRMALREVDVAFRQGGEEFVVLLPETDAYGGIIVAERLGAATRDVPVRIEPRAKEQSGVAMTVSISVSIGIAVYPEHGGSAQQVLDAADDALYAAKKAGRDTYRLADGVVMPVVNVTDPSVSVGLTDGQLEHPGSVTGASGGPQPPRQARGR
ncbi:diguanylate cyclase [Actinoplanes sp. N902-109]|uniref:diguanylate cyclase n=1 Tax=Actinoplanes sp. (strain N902-109) TaxID=649831 RepID=UPI00032968A4|nr:diguanylate cyclase [Actinoplanes sp. N902-109]AGL21097.1 diguanylate cyclase [Actinoplanes sp. N902-109]